MATTDDNKLRSLAAIVGVGGLALFGVTACDDGGTAEDPAVEEGAEDGADDGLDDGTEDDVVEEDAEDTEG